MSDTDSLGRVKSEQNPYFDTFSTAISTPPATAAYTNYTYDALSRVTNVTFPDFSNITVAFDHWTVSAYDQNMHRKDYHLDAYDRITKITEHNIDTQLDDGVVYLYNTTYGYDEADQLLRIVDAFGNNFTFTYDSMGRRTRLNDPDIGEWNYTYDLAGNLISQAGGGGNLITGDGFYREYNSLNQLIRIRNGSSINGALIEEYFYDPYGERIKIWRNDSAGTVIYTPFKEIMQIRNSTGIYNYSYIYDGSTLVARVNPDNTKHYYHPDHLGSTTLITNESGNIVEETHYEPYGDVTSGGKLVIDLNAGSSTTPNAVAIENLTAANASQFGQPLNFTAAQLKTNVMNSTATVSSVKVSNLTFNYSDTTASWYAFDSSHANLQSLTEGSFKTLNNVTGLGVNATVSPTHLDSATELTSILVEWQKGSGTANATEQQGDEAIMAAVQSSVPNARRYPNQRVYVVNASNTQWQGTADYLVMQDSPPKRWLLNYITTGETYLNARNLSNVVYVLELANKSSSQIEQEMTALIDTTKG